MKLKNKSLIFIAIFLIVISGLSLIIVNKKNNIPRFFEYKTIAHGMGAYKDTTITNSFEAFNESYEKGTRIFEVDLIETKEGTLVARHDWMDYLYNKLGQSISSQEGKPLTLAEFKNLKSSLDITPITYEDILDILKKYKDIYIVTDTKTASQEDAKRVFSKIVKEAKAVDKSLLDRIVPQIYNREMINTLNNIYEFQNVLYTLYLEYIPDNDVVDFAVKNNIGGIVMAEARYNEEFIKNLKDNGIYTYIHTVNDLEKAKFYIENGIDGIYTDFLLNGEFIE